jgi:hypothetical protein
VAAPYPSNILVAGLSNPVTKLTVTITGFNTPSRPTWICWLWVREDRISSWSPM